MRVSASNFANVNNNGNANNNNASNANGVQWIRCYLTNNTEGDNVLPAKGK